MLLSLGLAAVTATLPGCESNQPNAMPADAAVFDHSQLRPTLLESSQLSAAPALGKPSLLRVTDGILWVADRAGDPGLHALDAQSGELISSIGRRGEGPGEFARSPFGLAVAPGDTGAIWAFDLTLQRLTRFAHPSRSQQVTTVSLQGAPSIQRIAWISAERIIGQSNSEQDRFAIFSPDGRRLRTVAGTLLGSAEHPRVLRLNATNASIQMCSWPGRGFAVVYFFSGRIEFYDHDARFVRLANVPFASEPVFDVDATGRPILANPRQWYIDCTATDTHLFALFAGRLRSSFEGDARFSGDYVHVFDWNGELLTVFRLDTDIRGITVTDAGKDLYAGSLVDARIYRFALPPIPTDRRAANIDHGTSPTNEGTR